MTAFAKLFAILAMGLLVAGCAVSAEAEPAATPALTIEKIEGTDLAKLTLSERAIARLAIATAPVERQSSVGNGLTIPYAAVLYAADGTTWTYTNPQARVFVRAPITVERIDGPVALLSDGPPIGTSVVVVGSAELYGAERGVGGGH